MKNGKKMERQKRKINQQQKKKLQFSGDVWETVKKWYLKQNE